MVWVLGQFDSAEALLEAAPKLRELGYDDLDGHTPYPVHGMEEAFALKRSRVPLIVLCFGLFGASAGYFMQWFCNAFDFPINVGGRPFHAMWTNVPVTFECGVLLGGFAAFFGLFILCRLPRPHHPVFDAEPFRSHSLDRFWVSLRCEDGDKAEADLRKLGASEVAFVDGEGER
jgi:hypothetical protein